MGKQRSKQRASRKRGHPRVMENRQNKLPVSLKALELFLRKLNRELGLAQNSCYVVFLNDLEMKRLNTKFRKKPKTTDVLSFPSEVRTHPRSLRIRIRQVRKQFLGDIAISPTVALQNAATFGRTLSEEFCILILHGLLHLLGYDHETDRGEMNRLETTLRSRLGLT
jgi:probable rRNA maturation factor